jgi:hypothetical protein
VANRYTAARRIFEHWREHAVRRLDLVPVAPSGDERARESGVEEVDRDRVVEDPAHPRRRHGSTIGTAVLVEPGRHLRMVLTETPWWNADPDADREAPLGRRDYVARVTWHLYSLGYSMSLKNSTRSRCARKGATEPPQLV